MPEPKEAPQKKAERLILERINSSYGIVGTTEIVAHINSLGENLPEKIVTKAIWNLVREKKIERTPSGFKRVSVVKDEEQ